jgi:hypothetical protein
MNNESHVEESVAEESLAEACVASASRPRRRAARGPVKKSYAEPDDDPTDEEEDDNDRYAVATRAAATRRYAVGTSVYKLFPGHGYFWGTIAEADESGYKVVYTDGDIEDIPMDDAAYDGYSDEWDLREALHEAVAHAEREFEGADAATMVKPTKKARKAAATKKTAPLTKKKKAPSSGAAATAKATKKRKVKDDTDDEFVENDGEDESKDESLDENVLEDEDEQDDEEDNGVLQKQKKKGKSMAESFKATNVPLFDKLSWDQMDQQKEYFDPCGMEATDDIVSRVVGEQVDKIQGLLERVLKKHKDGKNNEPLVKLGTACSGTDAPALALTLIKEQWEQRSGLQSAGDFAFTHEFSCENDPFKQAYLARNFDSTLYPDIAKMTAAEPRDVYGQVQPIPDFNWFVAGTSCKNFSSLRSKWRLDIEDKGCSGETFLAAVEILFQEKPHVAIFENVQAAPWVSGSI